MRNARCGNCCFLAAHTQTMIQGCFCELTEEGIRRRAPACQLQAFASGAKCKTETSSGPACGAGSQFIFASSAGGPCSRFTHAACFSPAACRTARLLVADSSISARMACRSSVAEITGKSNTSAQPSASRNCKAVIRRAARLPHRAATASKPAAPAAAIRDSAAVPSIVKTNALQFFRNHKSKST